MKVQELRIGNLAICDKISLHNDGVFRVNKDVIFHFEKFKLSPILLTEEWLLRFGFYNPDSENYNANDEQADIFKYYLDSGISHRNFICKPFNGWIIKIGEYEDSLEVKYVHQFQNLYFYLIGEELIIKDKKLTIYEKQRSTPTISQ